MKPESLESHEEVYFRHGSKNPHENKIPMLRFPNFKLFAFLWFAMPMDAITQPAIVAHRGFSSKAPENTLVAFERAIAIGADYFELDVMASKDGVPMVIHDETIDRTCSDARSGKVNTFDAHELSKIYAGHPSKFGLEFRDEAIPTLDQALKLAKGRIKVCVEIKAPGIEEAILSVISKNDMNKDVIIFSFEETILQRVHQLDPDLPLLFLKEKCEIKDLDTAQSLHAQHIGIGRATELTDEFMQAVQERSLGVWQWTINDPLEMTRLLGLPLQGIITDCPDLASELLEKR